MIDHKPARDASSQPGGEKRRPALSWAIATLAILVLLITCVILVVVASRNP